MGKNHEGVRSIVLLDWMPSCLPCWNSNVSLDMVLCEKMGMNAEELGQGRIGKHWMDPFINMARPGMLPSEL